MVCQESTTEVPGAPNGRRVIGSVYVNARAQVFQSATVHVRVEDTSLADAPAKLVGEQVFEKACSTSNLFFSIEVEPVDEKARYTVSVHIDVDNDGCVSKGDYVSTESYPVLTGGHGNHVDVRVKQV
jgi:uncharacterized lipoprotein YbaY